MKLLIAPVFDEVTQYSVVWANEVAKAIEGSVQVLAGRPVTRAETEAACKDKEMLIFYDHGNETGMYGSMTEAVIDVSNCSVVPKEVYSMACLCAKDLGIEIWRQGKVFWGYTESFSFTTDALAEFQQFANNGILEKLTGATWKQALDATRNLGKQLADSLSQAGKLIASSCMSSNTAALQCYNGEPPTQSNCFWRRLGLKLFGVRGWALTKTRVASVVLFSIGVGMYFTHNVLSFPAGLILTITAFLVEWYDFFKVIDK